MAKYTIMEYPIEIGDGVIRRGVANSLSEAHEKAKSKGISKNEYHIRKSEDGKPTILVYGYEEQKGWTRFWKGPIDFTEHNQYLKNNKF